MPWDNGTFTTRGFSVANMGTRASPVIPIRGGAYARNRAAYNKHEGVTHCWRCKLPIVTKLQCNKVKIIEWI